MREVKLALLEADVNFKVVKDFVAAVKEKALGEEVMASLTPAQQVIKIVNEELTELMGGTNSKLTYSPKGFTVYLMVGLQGTGKTTTCGKLAAYLKKNGKKPMLCACDIYRPAAIDQLEVVGEAVDTPVFTMRDSKKPEKIALAAMKEAEKKGFNVLIVDTAGRLQIDEELMDELVTIKQAVKPHEILLVVDALTGQDAVNAAEGFNEKLGIDGIIMTKMDGDSRGGAALSAKKVTGKPIKFVGMGEKFDALEPFHPDRMASRILGMGDMLTLIEKAQEDYDEKKAAELEKEAEEEQLHAGGFSRADGADKKDGRHSEAARYDAGRQRQRQEQHKSRQERAGIRSDGGHHTVDDAGRAREPQHTERQPQEEDSGGERTVGHKDKPAREALQRCQEDDEELLRKGRSRQDEQDVPGILDLREI